MVVFLVGTFLILHGLVHLLYAGQSQRMFELQPGLTWPDGSWAFARLLGESGTRTWASAALAVAAICFVAAGVTVYFKRPWWGITAVIASVVSSLIFILFWDGGFSRLHDKGAVGVLINIVIIILAVVVRWPKF